MLELLNNPWTIGIGGGLISGAIVFLITSKIFSKRESKEQLQKIKMANKELLYSIRPLIVQEQLPTEEMMDSLLYATAKKYELQFYEIYDNEDIADDLIKETLENPFINSQSKLKYCELANKLKILGYEEEEEENMEAEPKKEIVYINKEKVISKEFFSLTLAMVSMMAVIVSVLAVYNSNISLINKNSSLFVNLIVLVSTITVIPLIALAFTRLLKTLKAEKKIQEDTNEINQTDDTESNSD